MDSARPPAVDRSLYAQLAQPLETREAANARLAKFMDAVQRLREAHGVAELLVVAGVHFKLLDEGGTDVASSVVSRGDEKVTDKLFGAAAQAFVARAARG